MSRYNNIDTLIKENEGIATKNFSFLKNKLTKQQLEVIEGEDMEVPMETKVGEKEVGWDKGEWSKEEGRQSKRDVQPKQSDLGNKENWQQEVQNQNTSNLFSILN